MLTSIEKYIIGCFEVQTMSIRKAALTVTIILQAKGAETQFQMITFFLF